MATTRIITDEGEAFCKAMGNPQGPHALACELVGTKLASWLGLKTFDSAILYLDKDDEIEIRSGEKALPGPAFVTRGVKGHTWGGEREELSKLSNPEDIVRLVIFDTWTLNWDRCPPENSDHTCNYDNVFLQKINGKRGKLQLVAMDHSHCFTGGKDLSERSFPIERIKDDRIYGLFPQFVSIVGAYNKVAIETIKALGTFENKTCMDFVAQIPKEWEVKESMSCALCKFICQRASYLSDNMEGWLEKKCWPQKELDFQDQGDEQ